MTITHRFGRRLPLPSVRQIRRELLLLWAADETACEQAAETAAPQRDDPVRSAMVMGGVRKDP